MADAKISRISPGNFVNSYPRLVGKKAVISC